MAGEERVHIALERSGGFGGLTLKSQLDTDHLDRAEADQIRSLVRQADVPSLARKSRSTTPAPGRGAGADRFQYDLTVTMGGQRHHLTYGDHTMPPQLTPLVNELVARAKRR